MMYREAEKERVNKSEVNNFPEAPEKYRSAFRRDYARLIHSPSFRRLQGKTQLFPSSENDFFRNRLTHSMEVSQIAKDIALKINDEYIKPFPERYQSDNNDSCLINTDLVEFAALSHDLGHPPFGHQGEEALDKCMIEDGGFEGNAQTLRLLSKIEKKCPPAREKPGGIDGKTKRDERVGLNLTYRTLASILKYDNPIPHRKSDRELLAGSKENIKPVKGYYSCESELVQKIKNAVTGKRNYQKKDFKTIECSIMDIADDIAYSTYDLEDGLKAGFYTPLDFITADKSILEKVAKIVSIKLKDSTIDWLDVQEVLQNLFKNLFDHDKLPTDELSMYKALAASYMGSKRISNDGYYRTDFSSKLVGTCIRAIKYTHNSSIPALSSVTLDIAVLKQVEILKRFNYELQIQSPRLKIAEYRGKEIVTKIFNALSGNQENKSIVSEGYKILPDDHRQLYENCDDKDKPRVVCDFIAGMTDRYLIEFYGRLFSENPESIFKPI